MDLNFSLRARRLGWLFIVWLAALALAACKAKPTATPSATAAPLTATASPSPTLMPTTTLTPTPEPTETATLTPTLAPTPTPPGYLLKTDQGYSLIYPTNWAKYEEGNQLTLVDEAVNVFFMATTGDESEEMPMDNCIK